MKLSYTIIYVPQVSKALEFFEKAFGLQRKFLHESGDYGELVTGETTLAFSSHEQGHANLPKGYVAASDSLLTLGVEIAFTTSDVHSAFETAIAAGAKSIKESEVKPCSQTIAYVATRPRPLRWSSEIMARLNKAIFELEEQIHLPKQYISEIRIYRNTQELKELRKVDLLEVTFHIN